MEKKIAIHGLGYVGLTAAVHWARAGWTVFAFDLDTRVIEALRAGKPRAGEFLGYLDEDVGRLVDAGLLLPTHLFADTLECLVHSIAVPTEKEGFPHDGIVLKLLDRLLRKTQPGTTILVESTLTPGTIDRLFTTELEDPLEPSGKCLRVDFMPLGVDSSGQDIPGLPRRYLAVCPRRDWFASEEHSLSTLRRNVGGVTPACTSRAVELLLHVSPNIDTADHRTIEITKALENAWLHASIGIAHELALNLKNGADVSRAVELASTHWRLPALFSSAGAGGRCVPLGTRYLLDASGPGGIFEAVNTAERHIRVGVASAVAQRRAKTALVLGVAYRPNFRDAGLSPGLDAARYMRQAFGVEVTVADPMWSRDELANIAGFPVLDGLDVSAFDAVILATPHACWTTPYSFEGWRAGQLVLDTQRTWFATHLDWAARGIEYSYVGAPGWLKS